MNTGLVLDKKETWLKKIFEEVIFRLITKEWVEIARWGWGKAFQKLESKDPEMEKACFKN